jgi:ABC-2 type transport system ATP-binding protein
VPWTADPSALNTTCAPIAFTTMVTSFDGTQISTNFFPALDVATGAVTTAPTILNGPGLGSNGNTDPLSQFDTSAGPGLVPGLVPLRDAGYNVVTWDPRGVGASGGTLEVDNPAFEGKDVTAIINWLAEQPESLNDGPNDPRVGMVGGSYGGGIQLVSAAIDPRIDAIVPGIAWNTLNASLYPNNAFKTSWATILVLDLVEAGARINPQLYSGILTGALLGFLTPSLQALLANSGPGSLVSSITAPTLLIQGTVDGLFPLQQAVTNEQLLAANGVPVKMIWFCGGHGVCLNPGDQTAQAELITADTLAWLDQYVMQNGTPANAIPNFQWVDQNGNVFSSSDMPSNPAFQGTPITASSTGGTLPIVPIIGGSGPQTKVLQVPGLSSTEAALLSLATAAPASNALNLTVPVTAGTQIVGAPDLTFTYSGIGTSTTVYAQIVDEQTGLVLGNIVTPIPVTLDGQTHTVSIALGQLNDIAYTAPSGGGTLELQLVGSATPFLNLTQFGVINVSSMTLTLPTVAGGVATPEVSPASEPLATVA